MKVNKDIDISGCDAIMFFDGFDGFDFFGGQVGRFLTTTVPLIFLIFFASYVFRKLVRYLPKNHRQIGIG